MLWRGASVPGLWVSCQTSSMYLAPRPCPDRSLWHSELSGQHEAADYSCSAVSQGNWSLWSRLHGGHVASRVPGCSISNKSRCSDGAATSTGQARAPTSSLRPADCACVGYQLPVGPAGFFIVRQSLLGILKVLFTLWLRSCRLSGRRCQSQSAGAGAQRCLPTGSLPLAESPCWRVDAKRVRSPRWWGTGVLPAHQSPRSCPQSPQHAASLAWGSAM